MEVRTVPQFLLHSPKIASTGCSTGVVCVLDGQELALGARIDMVRS